MQYNPSVSVILPVYNAESTISRCIESLLQLNYPQDKVDLVVVNNNSTDGTNQILHQFHDKIRLIHENKRGAAAARNTGILAATGDCVAFTDADCLVDTDWLRKIVLPLQNEENGIVGGKIQALQPGNRIEAFGEKIFDHHRAIHAVQPPYVIAMNWASRLTVLR